MSSSSVTQTYTSSVRVKRHNSFSYATNTSKSQSFTISLNAPEAKPEACRQPLYLSLPRSLLYLLDLAWSFTESNFFTFVVPALAFGVLGSLAHVPLVSGKTAPWSSSSVLQILLRLTSVFAYNWSNLLIFDFANQRSAESVAEDKINKPWRPIPSGKISMEQTRRAQIVAVPCVLLLNYLLGVWDYGVAIHIVIWIYNELRGGDELILRELLIAIGYASFNGGSLHLANQCTPLKNGLEGCAPNQRGMAWTAIISGIIFTTMHIQDLKDQEGDKTRGRKTIPLVFGAMASRICIAALMVPWSVVCVQFWGNSFLSLYSITTLALAATVSWRIMCRQTAKQDSTSWKLWCLWLVVLYALPVVSGASG